MAFSMDYVGSNGHICGQSGSAVRSSEGWTFKDADSGCILDFKIGTQGLSVTQNDQCNYHCGMRAANGFDAEFEF